MGRILAFDYGTKRVGIATTDPLKIICTPLETIHSKDIIDYIKNYLTKEDVEAFVIGMPVNLDGNETNNTQHVRGFVNTLKKTFPAMPLHLEDERYTSKMALDAMIAGGTSKAYRKKKENIDKTSAVIILQSYLEKNTL
ncbi:MAG: Holliday junction resolvase RuvX [Cytophagales bacterium]|nr:Holliday junction resolvase RuvX [Hyphobacterium sp. CCMP332]